MKDLTILVIFGMLATIAIGQNDGINNNSASGKMDVCATDYINHQSGRGDCFPLVTPCHDPEVRDQYTFEPGNDYKVVKTLVHVIRETDGTNPSATLRDVAMQYHHLNLDYAHAGIQFTYLINYIDDSSIRNVSTVEEQLEIMQDHATQEDIYCNVFVGGGVASFAFYPWLAPGSLGVFINELPQFYPANNRSSLSHEMGHALGLYHTFTGYVEISCDDGCSENMTSTGDLVGDFCSDTPPQDLSFDPGFTPTIDQCNDIPFSEIPHINYMSYSDNKREFSSQQIARMHCYLSTDPTRMGWLGSPDVTIPYVYGDDFGNTYYTSDLNESDWVDISETSVLSIGLLDDNVIGPFDIFFDISFYDETYSYFYIGSNGYLSFSSSPIPPGQFASIPSVDANNGYIAPFLTDLTFSGLDNPGKVYWQENMEDSLIVTFQDVPFYDAQTGFSGSNTFQVVITDTPFGSRIEFNYLEMESYYPFNRWQTSIPSLVGIENQDGTDGIEVNNYRVPDDLTRIVIEPPTMSTGYTEISQRSLKIFPNPTNNFIRVVADLKEQQSAQIYNVNGVLVKSVQKFQNGEFLSVQDLNEGVYYIRLESGIAGKFIVLR